MKIIPLSFSGIIILFCMVLIILSQRQKDEGEFPRVYTNTTTPNGTMLEGKDLQPAANPQYMQSTSTIK